MQGKKAMIRSFFEISSNIVLPCLALPCLALPCLAILTLYMRKQIDHVIGLPEVVLDVVIFSRDAELFKFIFERSALLEKAVDFAFDFH